VQLKCRRRLRRALKFAQANACSERLRRSRLRTVDIQSQPTLRCDGEAIGSRACAALRFLRRDCAGALRQPKAEPRRASQCACVMESVWSFGDRFNDGKRAMRSLTDLGT
jgi:hypothetical protein